jgi:AcrR family transcriptional regulator
MTMTLQRGRKGTQRDRLVSGMIAAGNRDGYARANVSAVISEAGVSRPTFYEYFADKDDCFVAALADVQGRLLATVRACVQEEPPERALHGSIRALVEFADTEPAMARFLMNESMAGGAVTLDARDHGIAAIEQLVQRRYRSVEPGVPVPDFSSRMLIGGIYRLLASRLRRGEPSVGGVLADLLGWIDAYGKPVAEHRWRSLKALAAPPPSPFLPEMPLGPPAPIKPGRPRLGQREAAENQRQRIMFAAARLAEEKGYNATTIGDITKIAGVDSRAFYAMFADKQEAFMAVHEVGFQRVMDVTATAFFSGATWPERNWEAGRAFTQFLEGNPLVANVGFVEAYAVGPGAVQRVEDSHSAFAMLLQEGYQHVPEDAWPSRLVLEAIITTIFETVYQRARTGGGPRLPALLAHITFLVLAPFMGAEQADVFIEEKLAGLAAG